MLGKRLLGKRLFGNRKIHRKVNDDVSVEVSEIDGIRSLHLGSVTVQSSMRLSDPVELVLSYTRAMMAFQLFLPRPQHVVMIGLGGGSLAKHVFHRMPWTRTTVIEQQPQVIVAARQYFHVPGDDERFSVELGEGSTWVAAHPRCCDVLMVDGYDGNAQVEELCSEGFYADARDALSDPGILVVNLWSSDIRFDAYLQRIEPFLLGGGGRAGVRGSPIYPDDQNGLEGLFSSGEIDMGCRFGTYATAISIETGRFPESAENVVFPPDGMIRNKSFIGVPANAPHPAAALVLANLLASPENQASKLATIGFGLGIDADLLPPDLLAQIEAAAPSLRGIGYDELAAATVPDTHASLVDVIERTWVDFIERRSGAFEQVVRRVFDAP